MNNDGRIAGAGLDEAAVADDVVARTQALWPIAATQAGLPDSGAEFRRLQVHSSKQDRRCALRVNTCDGKNYVLRAEFGQHNSERFMKYLERHKAAAEDLASVPGVGAPAILWQDTDRPFVLMEFARGDTAFRELVMTEYGLGDRAAVVRRIGQAVAALHRVSRVGEGRFRPRPFLRKVTRRAAAVRDGAVILPNPKKFLGLCAYLHRSGRRAKGQTYTAATEHGDLHFRNMLMSDTTVSFIDFSNSDSTIPQRDLACVWLANCPDHLAKDGQEPGYGLVAKADWAAFEDGYGAQITSDPLFQFFFALRLFRVWLNHGDKPQPLDRKSEQSAQAVVRVFDALLSEEPD